MTIEIRIMAQESDTFTGHVEVIDVDVDGGKIPRPVVIDLPAGQEQPFHVHSGMELRVFERSISQGGVPDKDPEEEWDEGAEPAAA